MRPWCQKMEAKLSFSDTTLSPPLLLLAFSLCGCVRWQSLGRFQPFTFYFNSI